MKIGIDINDKSISAALLTANSSVDFIEEPIYGTKRDCSRTIMEKVLNIVRRSANKRIKGIGLSLPSKIDIKRGTVYDLVKIPYWKGHRIKKILEDEFNTHVWVNNDANCFMLAERTHGICKSFSDALCITLGPNVGTSITVNGKLFMGNKYMFNHAKCLSLPSYECIRIYKESYVRTIEELSYICERYEKDASYASKQETWDEVGVLVGRLVSIMLCNYDPQVVVLGGTLAKSYVNFADAMHKYLEKFIHPHVLLNLIVIVSTIDHPHALGAASLVNPLLI
ncbi:ROK family protein [Prevotella sp. 10(H)]|uniref:ROK family protein n=1 Tax=Prevotella sp. 10(H) TaxID=1158294 RepID=UPI0004A72FB4|nr:ROK family protein [Prevotella sp. 10(H)]